MDVAEDRDVKLQRASGDLVAEFSAKLPSLLWRSVGSAPRTPRKWAPESKTERLVTLVREPLYFISVVCERMLTKVRSLSPFKNGHSCWTPTSSNFYLL